MCGRVGGGSGGRLEVHHLRSVERGGTDELANLLVLCRSCHIDGHRIERLPEAIREWQRFIRGGAWIGE